MLNSYIFLFIKIVIFCNYFQDNRLKKLLYPFEALDEEEEEEEDEEESAASEKEADSEKEVESEKEDEKENSDDNENESEKNIQSFVKQGLLFII